MRYATKEAQWVMASLVPRPPPSISSLAVLQVTESWDGSRNEAIGNGLETWLASLFSTL